MYLIGTSLKFCKNTKYILEEKIFYVDILYNNNNIKISMNNFYPTLIHIYSCLCSTISESSYFVDDPNLYNYIHNSLNNLGNIFIILV